MYIYIYIHIYKRMRGTLLAQAKHAHPPAGAGPFPAKTRQLTQGRRRCAQATEGAAGVCMLPQVCKDLSLFCNKNSAAGVRARQLCPLTCGCHDPFATLYIHTCICIHMYTYI